MSLVTCIYCHTSSTARFPREHLIPEAFGRFRNNLTLRCVCSDCNFYFSRELELILARDSGEALLRLRRGVKLPAEVRKLGHTRVVPRITEPGQSQGAWATLKPSAIGDKVEVQPLAQVGFCRTGDPSWNWLVEDQINDNPEIINPYRSNVEIRILGPHPEDIERLRHMLVSMGFTFKKEGPTQWQMPKDHEIEVVARCYIDKTIGRAIAKIAFNYLAFSKGATFALRDDFDCIRDYVRQGREPPSECVRPTVVPILLKDSPNWRQTTGHILTLSWNKPQTGLLAQVSFFNYITYDVLLCRSYSGLWHDIKSGHHFDFITHRITRIYPVLPPG